MINFTPERGQLLLCDFDMAGIPPEMRKKRRVVVVSPRSYNRARRCLVVPFSATKPNHLEASHVEFLPNDYRALTKQVWAICDAVSHVSIVRLDRIRAGKLFIRENLHAADLERIEMGLRHALGL